MKIMSRSFTTLEKVFLVVLVLILLGLVYYQFVDRAVRSSIDASDAEYQAVRTELNALQARIQHLTDVQNSMEALRAEGRLSYMGSYNNSKQEVAFLNDILDDTLEYSISFSNVTRSGDQIRRSFSLQYRTAGYEAAQDILTRLLEGRNRCLVGNVQCSIAKDGSVTMRQSATFYETIVGGEADAGLPESKANVNK